MAKKLFETKNKNKNNQLVELIRVGWSNLKDEIGKMSEDEKEIEKPDKMLENVEEIQIFNKKKSRTARFRFKNLNTKPNAQ